VLRLHGRRFFKLKKPDGTFSGDSVASGPPPPTLATIFPGTPYATACSGDVGYSTPSGKGAASYAEPRPPYALRRRGLPALAAGAKLGERLASSGRGASG